MLSGELPDKSYADKAVQTENVPTFDLLLDTGDAAEKDLSSKESRVVANELKVQEPLEAECTHPDSSIYLEAPLVNLHDSGEDQITSMASTCRAYSSGLSYRTLKTTSSRIVSLPETSSTFSAKTLLVKTSARVVSNPEHGGLIAQSQDSSGSCDSLDGSVDTDPYVSESQAREPLCSRSLATDAPYTPSPPSSPDSVVIIADKTELPRGFLRNKVALDNSMPSLRRDEEGWITWTRSPPRPIPALHGPLSLPYARCPSGAEGTVIEEQDNLPRIIWGLEGDDASSNRPPCDVVATLPTHSTPQKHHRVQQQPNGQVPPRFQSQPEAAQPSRDTSRKQNVQLPRTQPSRIPSPAPSLLSEHADLQRSLPGHGPIDLSNILRPRESVSNFSTRELYDALPQDSYSYGVNHGVSADWQSLILAQDKVQDHPMPSSVSVLADEIGNYLRPSFSTSTVSSLASSRSPIVIEPPGLPPSHQMIRQEAPRRTTALEIAQKYRQDQLQQYQQPALPTPPDSSSPIWNSRFSPHQHSFVSPDLLQRSTFPQGASGFTSTVSRSLRPRAGQGALDTHPFNTAATGIFSLERQTPHVTPQGSFLGTQDPPALDRTTVNSMLHLLQLRGSNSQVQGRPNTHVHSPARAKHSTSSAPAGTGLNRQALPQRSSSSPSSPITGTRAAHHQQPRTVSLNAVVQRRLSSVPEEDPTSLRGHTPSPAVSPTKYGPGNYPTGDLSTSSAIDVPPRPQQEDIIPPSPLVETGNRGNPLRGVMDLNGRRNFFPATQTEPYVGIPVGRGRSSTPGPAKGKGDPRQQDDPARAPRGRGKGRGLGKPRRGRGGPSGRGPERVDGGITVRS